MMRFLLIGLAVAASIFSICACCPGEIVDYAVYFDGGIPGAVTDAECAQYCETEFPGHKFVGCALRPAVGDLEPPHIGCEGQAICR